MSSMSFVGSSDFVDRSLPRHSTKGSKRSRANSRTASLDHRLSIIEEDGDHLRPIPQAKTHNRPFSRRFFGEPPQYSRRSPPKYSLWDVTGPNGEKFEDLRNNKFVARRGGWKRICFISFLVIACVIGLVVGLAVGLSKNHKKSALAPAAPSNATTSSPSTGPFPAGSYTFTTVLDTVSTNCTSNAASWKCEPAVTYAQDATNSEAPFNWIIAASSGTSSPTFSISSTNNPFAIDFSNASLSLVDAGTDQERYKFHTTFQKIVYPSLSVKCFYNETQFSGDLYTKKPKTLSNSTSPSTTSATSPPASTAGVSPSTSSNFAEWGYAVDATLSIGGGQDVPDCYQLSNGQIRDPITSGYFAQPAGNFCSCAYKNYDP